MPRGVRNHKRSDWPEVRARIIAMRRAGESMGAIHRAIGVNEEAIRKVCCDIGLPPDKNRVHVKDKDLHLAAAIRGVLDYEITPLLIREPGLAGDLKAIARRLSYPVETIILAMGMRVEREAVA